MFDLSASGSQLIDGPEGAIEVLIDQPSRSPSQPPVGVVVVAHPQPLLGGSALHKVPQFLARGLADAGWLVIRPNFRGVGRSAGTHDAGDGESQDLLSLVQTLQSNLAVNRVALVGFSFGAFVAARVARLLAESQRPACAVALAGMPFGEVQGGRRYDTPDGLPHALVVHGELDERVPLAAVLDWARPQSHPVVVVPGADHFFAGKLHVLRALITSHLRS